LNKQLVIALTKCNNWCSCATRGLSLVATECGTDLYQAFWNNPAEG
jgi:hypothetical protein